MTRATYDVLVAEPDEAKGQIVDMLLADPAYDLTIVTSGRATLEYLKSSTPDLCLLALDLPDVAGDHICAKARSVTRLADVPIVLIAPQSGRFGLSTDARRRAKSAAADLVLPRPLGDKNLRERVQSLLDAQAAKGKRGGHSTRVIEEALAELDAPPDEVSLDPAVVPDLSDAFLDEVPSESDAASGHEGSRRTQEAHAADGTAPAEPAHAMDGPDHAGDEDHAELAQLRKEREILQVENAQLKRKLKEKQEVIARGENPKLEERIAELERRNAALLERVQELEGDTDDGHPGGFFRRRR